MTKQILLKLSLSLIFSTAIIPVAIADYKPPADQKPPKYSNRQQGTRGGCSNDKQESLQLLAPEKYVGETTSTHPTFAWQFNESNSLTAEFRLYQYSADNTPPYLLYELKTQTQPGMMTVSLPDNLPGLVKGQKYLWQVAILCDPNSPSEDIVKLAEFELKDSPPELQTKLAQTQDHLTRAKIYAKGGFWYDALAEVIETKKPEEIIELLKTLNK